MGEGVPVLAVASRTVLNTFLTPHASRLQLPQLPHHALHHALVLTLNAAWRCRIRALPLPQRCFHQRSFAAVGRCCQGADSCLPWKEASQAAGVQLDADLCQFGTCDEGGALTALDVRGKAGVRAHGGCLCWLSSA